MLGPASCPGGSNQGTWDVEIYTIAGATGTTSSGAEEQYVLPNQPSPVLVDVDR